MALKNGDRVILRSQLTTPAGDTIEAGTVCTIVSFLSNEMAIVRYGFDKKTESELVFGVAISLLSSASIDELESADLQYENLVSKSFHVGQKYLTGPTIKFKEIEPNTKGTIVGVIIGSNESEDIVQMDFETGEVHELNRDFVQKNFFKCIDELEENLGDEIIMTGTEKNFHIVGAKVIAEDTNEVVIIASKSKDDDEFLVENLDGKQIVYKKEYLHPILNPEFLYSIPKEGSIQKVCQPGKSLKANDNIDKNILLKDEFKPGDVVKIINIESVNINAFEDTFTVKRTGGKEILISYADLRYFFTPIKGLVKNATNTGKVEEVISSEEVDKIFKNKTITPDRNTESMEEINTFLDEIENKTNDTPKVVVHDISIDGYRFKINNGLIEITFKPDEIDKLVNALITLKQYI